MHRNITPSTLQRFNRANPTLPDDNHDHGQSEQSDKNDHGHGDHSDNRHHDYANVLITLFGQTNRKWVNWSYKLKRWQTLYIHDALRNEGGKYWLVMQG